MDKLLHFRKSSEVTFVTFLHVQLTFLNACTVMVQPVFRPYFTTAFTVFIRKSFAWSLSARQMRKQQMNRELFCWWCRSQSMCVLCEFRLRSLEKYRHVCIGVYKIQIKSFRCEIDNGRKRKTKGKKQLLFRHLLWVDVRVFVLCASNLL